jgi:hypothetical protein
MTRGQHEDDHGYGESDGEQTHENPFCLPSAP